MLSLGDCLKLGSELNKRKRYFQTNKKDEFVLWYKILKLLKWKKDKTKVGVLEICELRDKLAGLKTRTDSKKYRTKEDVMKLFRG